MSNGADLMPGAVHAFKPEMFVADTDVVLGDACSVLATGHRSELLRALTTGAAIAFMSEQAFREVGWMSAKSARYHGVDDDALRELITRSYLPRIPVVSMPGSDSEQWTPAVDDVSDPDDVPHLQVARLISARAVYSHDGDLRRPGFAPATRADYDRRIVHLSVLSGRSEAEHSVGLVVGFAGAGTSEAVSWTSVRFNVRPALVWFGLVLLAVTAAYLVLAPPARRRRVTAGPAAARHRGPRTVALDRIGAAVERSETARHELSAGRLIEAPYAQRLEIRVASHLARHPDLTMGELAEALGLNATGRRHLSTFLRTHPAFERASRYGWSVGRRRSSLETQPPLWAPRPPIEGARLS